MEEWGEKIECLSKFIFSWWKVCIVLFKVVFIFVLGYVLFGIFSSDLDYKVEVLYINFFRVEGGIYLWIVVNILNSKIGF